MTDEQLFHNAIALRRGEQSDYLDNASLDDDQKKRVKALLLAHAAQDSLLDTHSAAEAMRETAAESNLARSIGDFEIVRELGRGGMGVVYEARQKSLKRKVALKVLSSGLGLSSKAILRFRREAEAAGKLHHTNIVPIYTTGEDKGIHYYAMELVDGPSLDHVIKDLKQQDRGSPPDFDALQITAPHVEERGASDQRKDAGSAEIQRGELKGNAGRAVGASANSSSSISTASGTNYFDQVATMIAEVADALDHAHEHGVIHRDVKPSNLLLGPDGRLSINDFGLARMLEQPGMTVSGEFVGSPLYMSPEQITAGRVALDHRTDIYSLGATLYELLTLQPPFPGQSRDQVLSQILHKEAASTRKHNRKIPVDLDTICMKAIDKDPDRRYQTAAKLAEDLRKYVNRHAISARRISIIGKSLKLARRNVGVTVLTSCLVLLLLAFGLYWETDRRSNLSRAKRLTLDYIFSGDLEKAKRECKRAVSLWADAGWEQRTLGHIALYNEEYEQASIHFEQAAEKGAAELPLKCLSSLLAFYKGDEMRYFAEFNSLRDSQPSTTEEKLLLGLAGVWNDPHRSIQWLSSAADDEPNSPAINYSLGYANLNVAIDCTGEVTAEKYLRSAVESLERCLDHWPDNEMATCTLLQCYLVAKQRGWDVDGLEQMNDLAMQLESGVPEGEALLTLYWYAQQQQSQDHAARLVFDLLDDKRCNNYLAAYALIQCYRLGETQLVEKAYSRIHETPSFTDTARVSSTKRSFKELALLFTIQSEEERSERLKDFKAYLAAKHGQGDYSQFEQDWLVLWLYGADEQDRDNLIIESRSHFKSKFSTPQQEDLLPILDYFLDGKPEKLLQECELAESKRALSTAYFAMGVRALSEGRHEDAREAFRKCTSQNCYQYYVYQWGLVFQERLPRLPDFNDAPQHENAH